MARGWRVHTDGKRPVHVWPPEDLVEHDLTSSECTCGPTDIPVQRPDGSIGWLVKHHSLDGRERQETRRG